MLPTPTSFWCKLQSPSQWARPSLHFLPKNLAPASYSLICLLSALLVPLNTGLFKNTYCYVYFLPLQLDYKRLLSILFTAAIPVPGTVPDIHNYLLSEWMVSSCLRGKGAEQSQLCLIIFPKFATLSELPFPKAEWAKERGAGRGCGGPWSSRRTEEQEWK